MTKKVIILPALLIITAVFSYLFLQQSATTVESKIKLYGHVDIREAQLSFNSSEHINAFFVQEGDHVTKGQLLATLHTDVLEAQLVQAEAELLTNQQKLAKLEAGNRKEEINKARAEYYAAKARTKSAVDSYERLKQLIDKQVISPDQLQKSQAVAESAKAETEAVRQALILLEAGARSEDIAIAKAVVVNSEANVRLAKLRLDNANLYAPDNGVIRNRILEPGDMAFPQTPVITLAFTNPVWVRAYLPEPALGKITLGSPANIFTDSFAEKSYTGWVGYISPTAEFTPKVVQTEELRTRLVYSVKIFACNPQDELRLGMPVTVEIDTQSSPEPSMSFNSLCD